MASPGRVSFFEKKTFLDSSGFPCVAPLDFYRDLFPVGSFERSGALGDHTGNGLIVHLREHRNGHAHHDLIFDEHKEIERHLNMPNILIAPCSFFGNRKTTENVHECFAYTIDLDGVGEKQLRDLIYQCQNKLLPTPTYIVNSGAGVHLYYIFENPIPMYPKNQIFLKELKAALTDRVWNDFTSTIKRKQFQGIVQAFRAVGSVTKYGNDCIVTAYKTGNKVDIDTLVSFVITSEMGRSVSTAAKKCPDLFSDPNYVRSLLSAISKSELRVTLEEAKKRWPEWHEKRIEKKIPAQGYLSNKGLYDWWLRKMKTEIRAGQRYHSIFILSVLAKKCGVDKRVLAADAESLFEYYDSLSESEENRFLHSDLEAALTVYDNPYAIRYKREYLEFLTHLNVKSKPIKRNGRPQDVHLRLARSQKANLIEIGENVKGGRPSKEFLIRLYLKQNPDEKKNYSKIARELGINRDTVAKWVKIIENEGVNNG